MRWLITGSKGQLGTDLQTVLADTPSDVVHAVDVDVLDITDSTAVQAVMEQFAPDVIVNAAAYTAVDRAEEDEDTAYAVNATGPAVLAAAAARAGIRLIHVSTDYVFAGDANRPYEVDDEPAPKSAYGRTKLAGERAVRELLPETGYVVRTAWVYGAGGGNFVKTMARLEKTKDTITVVDDQRGSPTWSFDLAVALVELARSDAPAAIYHCTGTGDITWFAFAQAIFTRLGADPARVLPTTSEAYGMAANRPTYSVLSDRTWREAGLNPMPEWSDALSRAFATVGESLRGA
ncbi:dTDP-4-dehydrorhamnose reductase [Jatrophihabitans telluris]|uniref:dTDP-4-dehydrorhamnose reductase n=1 Tax=Jatrophihabitans telluris TaxID=2038343 RepID=A0ABY4QX15_9ACTN|nr:dTDP-4-dehydrorhamnose reductase [Jatrophihabitans telluris]UQX87561.1 dTDP-4-dehydrorhamnose reductase [Jatrophihabitans telluris]